MIWPAARVALHRRGHIPIPLTWPMNHDVGNPLATRAVDSQEADSHKEIPTR